MTKKTYADECIERAGSIKPKLEHEWSDDGEDHILKDDACGLTIYCNYRHADLYEHAAADVPELARRLKKACEVLREMSIMTLQGDYPLAPVYETIAQELEAMPEDKEAQE